MKANIPDVFIRKIREYNLDSLLKYISRYSLSLFYDDKSQLSGTKLYSFKKGFSSTGLYVTSWGLVDLSYYAIKYTTNDSNKCILSEEEFLSLYILFNSYYQKIEKGLLRKYRKEKQLFFYIYGMLGEQSLFQMNKNIYGNFCREQYIINEILSNSKYKIDIDDIFINEIGLCNADVCTILFGLWTYSREYDVLPDEIINSKYLFSKKNIEKIMNYYSSDIDYIRKSPQKRQFFYSKPFIRLKNNEYIYSNYYLGLFSFQNCSYWILRNYYYKKNSRYFTSVYGQCFEEYFLELLKEYVEPNNYYKIEEGRRSRADWKLTLGRYNIIVEQKSALVFLDAKQQMSNVERTIDYLRSNWIKAVKQLNYTQKELYDDIQCIKIILVYDDYYIDDTLDYILDYASIKDIDDLYWVVSINEMENLLYLYKYSENIFSKIMDKKIRISKSYNAEKKSLQLLFNEYNVGDNLHIDQDKYKKYFDMMINKFNEDLEE